MPVFKSATLALLGLAAASAGRLGLSPSFDVDHEVVELMCGAPLQAPTTIPGTDHSYTIHARDNDCSTMTVGLDGVTYQLTCDADGACTAHSGDGGDVAQYRAVLDDASSMTNAMHGRALAAGLGSYYPTDPFDLVFKCKVHHMGEPARCDADPRCTMGTRTHWCTNVPTAEYPYAGYPYWMPCDNGSCCDRLPTREICVTASETVPSAGTHSTQCHWDVGAETCAAGDCGGVLEARVQSMEAAGLTWGGEVPMQGAYACCKIAWHPDLLDYVDGADENSNTVRTVGGVSAAFGIVKNRYGYMKDVLDHDTLNLDYGKPTRKGMTLADEYTELYVIGEMCAGDFMEMKEFEDWKKILCELKCYNLYGEERPEQNDLHAQYGAPGA